MFIELSDYPDLKSSEGAKCLVMRHIALLLSWITFYGNMIYKHLFPPGPETNEDNTCVNCGNGALL